MIPMLAGRRPSISFSAAATLASATSAAAAAAAAEAINNSDDPASIGVSPGSSKEGGFHSGGVSREGDSRGDAGHSGEGHRSR